MNYFYILVVLGIFMCSCSQLLLKKSANKYSDSWLLSFFNWRVVLSYVIFFGSLMINITAMRHGVELKNLPILESLGYIFVPLLSYVFLAENITKRSLLSIVLIIIGILIFYQ